MYAEQTSYRTWLVFKEDDDCETDYIVSFADNIWKCTCNISRRFGSKRECEHIRYIRKLIGDVE